MIALKIGKIKFNLPTSWEDVTLEQYLEYAALGDTDDILSILAAFTGVSSSIWAKVDFQSFNDLIVYKEKGKFTSLLSWLEEPVEFNKLPIPDWLKIDEIAYKVPNDLGEVTLAQHISVTNLLKSDNNEDVNDQIAEILAIFFYPIISGNDYDESKALEMSPVFLKCKWVDVCPIADFFFQKAAGYGSPLPKLVEILVPKKFKRILVNLMRSV